MEAPTTSSSKSMTEASHTTRRNTRSTSNQEKEKENAENARNNSNGSSQDSSASTDLKKRQKEHVIRAQNGEVLEYTTEDNITYRPLDSAYLMSERADNPYFICTIDEIKVSKRDNAMVVVKWYYRPTEVPDLVYQMLIKDRINQVDDPIVKELIQKPDIINREMFIADHEATDTYPISCLRGKCELSHYSNINEIKDFELRPDHFFYIFSYNPETRRLASLKGETRVGPSHQWTATTRGQFQKAQLPDLLKPSDQLLEKDTRIYEEMTWEPKVNDCDLIMCLRAARSMAAFAGICDGVSPEMGCIVASRDDTTINALRVLYENNGNPRKAIEALVKNPVPVTIESKWTEEQVKRFQRGLRLHGKDFFKIRKDLLPMKETGELVEFYYLWKKTQDGLMIRPHHRKHRRMATSKKNNKHKTNSATGSGDQTSTEEETEESEESEKELGNFKCKHCLATASKDWLEGGKEGVILCTDCRIFYKKYGENRPIIPIEDIEDSANEADVDTPPVTNSQLPPFLFKPIKEEKMNCKNMREPTKGEHHLSEQKKPNKRQWSDSDEVAIKQEVTMKTLKRAKMEKEEVSKDNKVADMELTTSEEKRKQDIKVGNAMARVTRHSPYSSSFVKKTESEYSSVKSEYANSSVNSVTSLSSAIPISYLPPPHSVYPPTFSKQMLQKPAAEMKSQLGLDAVITPLNGIRPTVAYFGPGTVPPRSATATQHSTMASGNSSTVNTTTINTNTVRTSPSVEPSRQGTRSPKVATAHSSNPTHHPASQRSDNPSRLSVAKVPDNHNRPPTIKTETGQYLQVPSSHQKGSRFPFDPCVTDQIISRASIKEEANPSHAYSKVVPPHAAVPELHPQRHHHSHQLPVRGSPLPLVPKSEPHHSSFKSGEQLRGGPGHYDQQRSHHRSPLPHGHRGPSINVPPGSAYPGQFPHGSRIQPAGSPGRHPLSSTPGISHYRSGPHDPSDSDVEVVGSSRGPAVSPPPTPCDIVMCPPTSHSSARFIKTWDRGQNSCLRTDYVFAPNQESITKQQKVVQQHKSSKSQEQSVPQTSKHQRTASQGNQHIDQERRREEKHQEPAEKVRRDASGPPSSSSYPSQGLRSTPGHSNVPRMTPNRTPTSLYEQHHRINPAALMSPYDIGTDTPALRQLQQYATNDLNRSAEAIHTMPSFLYPPLYMDERDYRERLRERESRERLSKIGLDITPPEMLDPHNPNIQHLQPPMMGLPQALSLGIPVSLAGPSLSAMEQQLQLRQYQAQLLSGLPPGPTPHPALAAAAAALHPGGVNPFTHPEAYQNAVERLSAERLQAERFAAEQQYQLELLHHHQHSHVHSHLHLHQPGQPGGPPLPGGPVPLSGLPPPHNGLALVQDQLMHPYAAMQAAAAAADASAIGPYAASAANPLLLNPALRSQQTAVAMAQATLMNPSHAMGLHSTAMASHDQSHSMSATQQLQAVHEQQRARAVLHEQQYLAARLAGHKP